MQHNSIRYLQATMAQKAQPKTQIHVFDITEKIFIKAAGLTQGFCSIHGGSRARRKDLPGFLPRIEFKAMAFTPDQTADKQRGPADRFGRICAGMRGKRMR